METDKYPLVKLLGETEQFRIYECELPGSKVGMLKISTEIVHNGLLDREAYVLRALQEEARLSEEAYARENPGSETILNYGIYFPNLVDSFIASDQGGRKVLVSNFTHVDDDLSRLVPLDHIITRDRVRVDPRTSAWILGKLLKLLVFTQNQGMAIGNLTGENILIERDQHFVIVFDWSSATFGANNLITSEVASREISEVAKGVISLLGGDPETGELLPDEQLENDRYQKYLRRLALGFESNAVEAHRQFYKLIWDLWPSKFWPYTTYNLEEEN